MLYLQLGDVLDPRTFWAHETKRVTRSVLRVRRLEARLAETARVTGAQLTAATPPGVAVAVARRGPGGDKLVRGRLVQTFTLGERLLATVFMLDYGLTLDRVDAVKFVRRIEDSFLSEAPLAFQVVLAGLSPVSMDLDWSVGGSMSSVAVSSWDAAALSLVRRIVTESGGEAELVDTMVDPRGRRHGQLLIITRLSKGEVNLFTVLILHDFLSHFKFN